MKHCGMSFEQIRQFLTDLELWKAVTAGVIVAIMVAIGAFVKWIVRRRRQSPSSAIASPTVIGPESQSQVASGSEITQDLTIDRSCNKIEGVYIGHVELGATVNITIIDYKNGLSQAPIAHVKTLFEEGRAYFTSKQFNQAITKFRSAIEQEKDHRRLGALNLQIGNCYYEQRHFLKAAESYATALREIHQAGDREGEASTFASIGNTYVERSASDSPTRGKNLVQAVDYYVKAASNFPQGRVSGGICLGPEQLGSCLYRTTSHYV